MIDLYRWVFGGYRFKMIVVEECVFDRHEAAHAMNLFDMHQKYADVVSLAEVGAHFQAMAASNGRAVRSTAAAL